MNKKQIILDLLKSMKWLSRSQYLEVEQIILEIPEGKEEQILKLILKYQEQAIEEGDEFLRDTKKKNREKQEDSERSREMNKLAELERILISEL